jgi:purine/pyrimidine-nucleoside phosphorylase
LTPKENTMTEFKNVTVVKAANIYFDGKVTSRTIFLADGSRKTLGIMLPGDYAFDTADREIVEILGGTLDVLLPGAADWRSVEAGQSFDVPAQSKFSLKVKTLTDYCCTYTR